MEGLSFSMWEDGGDLSREARKIWTSKGIQEVRNLPSIVSVTEKGIQKVQDLGIDRLVYVRALVVMVLRVYLVILHVLWNREPT